MLNKAALGIELQRADDASEQAAPRIHTSSRRHGFSAHPGVSSLSRCSMVSQSIGMAGLWPPGRATQHPGSISVRCQRLVDACRPLCAPGLTAGCGCRRGGNERARKKRTIRNLAAMKRVTIDSACENFVDRAPSPYRGRHYSQLNGYRVTAPPEPLIGLSLVTT